MNEKLRRLLSPTIEVGKRLGQRVTSALFVACVLPAGGAAAQNLVTNPGFETGDASGWFAFGTPAMSIQTGQVHSGNAAEVTNRTATYIGIAQSLVGSPSAGQDLRCVRLAQACERRKSEVATLRDEPKPVPADAAAKLKELPRWGVIGLNKLDMAESVVFVGLVLWPADF